MEILKYFKTLSLKYFMKFLIFIIKWLKTFKNMIKVYEVSRKYIMLFVHNNRYKHLKYSRNILRNISWNISRQKISWNFKSLIIVHRTPLSPKMLRPLDRYIGYTGNLVSIRQVRNSCTSGAFGVSQFNGVIQSYRWRGRWNCGNGHLQDWTYDGPDNAGLDIDGLDISGRVCESELGNTLSFWSSVLLRSRLDMGPDRATHLWNTHMHMVR